MKTANITSNDSLHTRLHANKNYGSFDFHSWVFGNCAFQPGMDILDVGCGNGAQVKEALRALDGSGSVTALDISEDSVAELRQGVGERPNLELVVADMRDLGKMVEDRFRVKRYDLVHSTYALFYGREHIAILESMRQVLKPGGRLMVTTPVGPNGLRQTINRMGFATPQLAQIDSFDAYVLEPYFRSCFDQINVQYRRNLLKLPSVEETLKLYRSTAYHFEEAEAPLARLVEAEIAAKGYFAFEKNAYMIEGLLPS